MTILPHFVQLRKPSGAPPPSLAGFYEIPHGREVKYFDFSENESRRRAIGKRIVKNFTPYFTATTEDAGEFSDLMSDECLNQAIKICLNNVMSRGSFRKKPFPIHKVIITFNCHDVMWIEVRTYVYKSFSP